MRAPLAAFSNTLRVIFFIYSLIFVSFIVLSVSIIFGYVYGLELVIALSFVAIIALIFLFYFFYTNTWEYLFKHASRTASLLDKEIKASSPDMKAEELFTQALSISYLPPKLSRLRFCNTIYGLFLWQPFHNLIERLLIKATEHLITQIKLLPTHLNYHAALANLYVTLSNHYMRPLSPNKKIFLSHSTRKHLEEKSKIYSKRAVEELSILRSFAPHELWVHDQLAISYRELSLPEKEIEEYEAILNINPEDYNALLRLGILYFSQGKNAKGLEVYEQLNVSQPLLAETLINHYGAYTSL